jgi:hypothetical protein
MSLKDLKIKNLKPPEKPLKLDEGGGFFLYLTPSRLKYWRYEYAFQARRSPLDLRNLPGPVLRKKPEISLRTRRGF